MEPITATEARKNQNTYIEKNKELIEKPARECLEDIYRCIDIASKSGKNFISWSDAKYSLIILHARQVPGPSSVSKFIINELKSNGYSVTLDDEAQLRISW